MNELPKELTPELLGLVLDDVLVGAITEMKPYAENDIVYTTYELPTIKYKILNIDTLTRLIKEWCWKHKYYLESGSMEMGYCSVYEHIDTQRFLSKSKTEFEAVLKATHWVAKEKGLIK